MVRMRRMRKRWRSPTQLLLCSGMLAHSLVALISEAHVGRRNGGMAVVAQVTFAILSHSRRDAGRKATDSLDVIRVPHALTHSHTFSLVGSG
jgi:hypothetical protein